MSGLHIWSFSVRSCIVHPLNLARHCPVRHFPPARFFLVHQCQVRHFHSILWRRYKNGRGTDRGDYRIWLGECCSTGNREQAFVYALSSASLVHAVAKACSSGLSSKCHCGSAPAITGTADPSPLPAGYHWGGCADDVRFAASYGEEFADAVWKRRRRISRRTATNHHNSVAGRTASTLGSIIGSDKGRGVMRWLQQLRFDVDLEAVQRLFDCLPKVIKMTVTQPASLNHADLVIMPPPLIGGGIKRCFCLTSVWLTSVCRIHRA